MGRVSGRTIRYILGGFGVIAVLTVIAPLPRTNLTASLDSSYTAVLSFAAVHHLQFGRDIIFTGGPLAHLFLGIYHPELFPTDLWADVALEVTYLAAAFVVSLRLPRLRRALFLFSAFLAVFFSHQAMFLLLLVVTAWVAFAWKRNAPALSVSFLVAGAAVTLIKATFLFFSVFALFFGFAYLAWRQEFKRIAFILSVGIVAFISLWFLAGQHLSNLWPYFWSSAEMVRGYAGAMSLIPPPAILLAGVVGVAAGFAQLAVALFRNRSHAEAWFVASILAVALFMAWKLGYTRADAHTVELFYFEILMLLALPAFLPAGGSSARVFDSAMLIAVVGFGLFVIITQLGTILPRFGRAIAERFRFSVSALISPAEVRAKYEFALRKNIEALQLPAMKQAIGTESVDVFGCEQAVAIANDLRYTPRPVFQGYLTYTPALAEINAAFYRSPRAPRFVIFKLQAIDARLPAIDDADLLPILARDYQVVLHENGYLLLERRRAASAGSRSLVTIKKVSLGETATIPHAPIWARLRFHQTPLARLLGLVYQAPQLWTEVTTRDGHTLSYRLPATMAAHGFLLSPLLRTTGDFEAFAKGEPGPADVRAIRALAKPASPALVRGRVTCEFSQMESPLRPPITAK